MIYGVTSQMRSLYAQPSIAYIHTAAAFMIAVFVVVHVYMTTTGKTVFHYLKTMITGYDNVELTEAEEAYIRETGSVSIKN